MKCISIIMIMIMIIFILKRGFKKPAISRFTNYKRVTITPKEIIYNKLQLNIPPNKSLYNNIAKQLKQIFPIHTIDNTNYDLTNLKLTNTQPNIISIVHGIRDHNSEFSNIRYVSSIGVERFTLFSHNKIASWTNLTGKTIATLSKKSASYSALLRIRNRFKIPFKIKIIKKLDMEVATSLKKNTYDAVFVITSHPNRIIRAIHKSIPLTFIGTAGLNDKILKIVFPDLHAGKIDLTYYDIYNNAPDTVISKLDIVCNRSISPEYTYLLVKTLFKNLLNIKTTGDDDYKLHMKDFNPEFMYLSNNLYTLHDGVHDFYKEIGLITYNKERSCRYKAGVGECNIKKLNHFRLL